MPTLKPQQLSGLVVIPTVESQPGLHVVSIAINVGQSRTPPPEVVSREDLVVELRAGAEGPLEAIASPDPGPLPVRSLRVAQARGDFTFAQGVNPPSELKVTLRGDQKTFPMSQTFATTGRCVAKPPAKGDPFPGARKPRRFPIWWPLRKRSCCVKRFDAPFNSATDPAAKSEYFEIEADFIQRGRCQCGCCEYRQFVRGRFTDANGADVRFDLPSGALSPSDYCEDGSIDEFGSGSHGFYGRRSTSTPGDDYGGKLECNYRGRETAGSPPTDTVQLEFLGLVVDTCRRRVADVRTWSVSL
jgi:hypothetical protein